MKRLISNKLEFLYHATYKEYIDSIKQNGLGMVVPKKNWNDSKDGVVYLANDPYIALSYAEISEEVPDKWLNEIVILQIDVSQLNKKLLFCDENVIGNQGTYEYHDIIPWSAISLFTI